MHMCPPAASRLNPPLQLYPHPTRFSTSLAVADIAGHAVADNTGLAVADIAVVGLAVADIAGRSGLAYVARHVGCRPVAVRQSREIPGCDRARNHAAVADNNG